MVRNGRMEKIWVQNDSTNEEGSKMYGTKWSYDMVRNGNFGYEMVMVRNGYGTK